MADYKTWADVADRYLAPLFADGRQPSDKEIREAYPFGPRQYWPYKAWLKQVRWWKAGCPPQGPRRPARGDRTPLPGQEVLL